MATKFNVGDWVFCDLSLHQIAEMRGDDITGVWDGYFQKGKSSWNDEVFPLDMNIKVISDAFSRASHKLHRDGPPNLNFPDIHRWLIAKWTVACREKDDREKVQAAILELDEWTRSILERCKEVGREEVGGIRLFR